MPARGVSLFWSPGEAEMAAPVSRKVPRDAKGSGGQLELLDAPRTRPPGVSPLSTR